MSVPYILSKMTEEFRSWKQHFIDQAKGNIPHQRIFYKVSKQEGSGEEPNIKLVTPTEQVVERAKSTLSQPPSIYDPVTGIMQQTGGKHTKILSSRTQKRKRHHKVKKKTIKRRKISKRKTTSKRRKPKQHNKKKKVRKTNTKNKWWH